MDISRLTSTSALISALRRDVIAKGGAAGRPAALAAKAASQAHGSGAATPSLRRELAGLVQGVDLDDPEAVRHLRSRFVRAVLLWEFGPQLREHPEWRGIMDGVERALDGMDDAARNEFRRLLGSLQARPR